MIRIKQVTKSVAKKMFVKEISAPMTELENSFSRVANDIIELIYSGEDCLSALVDLQIIREAIYGKEK